MNRVIHFEVHATDTAKMADFYRSVFGWEVRRWENPNVDYWIVMTGPDVEKGKPAPEPGINGGIVGRRGPAPQGGGPVSALVCTIDVPSGDEYIKKVTAAGGTLAVPKMPIHGLAWLAYCKDIEGNMFGLFEEDKGAK
jgi:uncharacterized protein